MRAIRYQDFESKLVIVMIESTQAVGNLDAILAVEGIDVFFVGPDDLSRSMGLPGQIPHPKVQGLLADIAKRVRAAGRMPGTLVTGRHSGLSKVERGYGFLYEHLNNFARAGARSYRNRLSK